MFVVIVVWFCCSSRLAFLIMADLINLMRNFLLHWVICHACDFFVHTHFLLKNTVPHLVDMPKIWMSGVGTLCADAHYQASLSNFKIRSSSKTWRGSKILLVFVSVGQLNLVFHSFARNLLQKQMGVLSLTQGTCIDLMSIEINMFD